MIGSIEVRYDGRDAAHHAIAAGQLAESLAGFNRLFATAFHFALTEQFVSKAPAQSVTMLVRPDEPKCVNLLFEAWELAKQQQAFSGFAGAVVAALIGYFIARAGDNRKEMKHLAEALKIALAQNGQRDASTVDRLLQTVDRMADAMRPAVRQAVAPVGASCETVRVGGVGGVIVDPEAKARIMATPEAEFTDERRWPAVLTELDRENATGKVRLDGDPDSRVAITITDPAFNATGNPYLRSFVDGVSISLSGKAEIVDGDIRRLYVSNAE